MRCPHCLQLVKVAGDATQCPECAEALRDDEGRELRRIDVDFEMRLQTMDVRAWERLKKGTWIALAISAVSSLPVLHWFGGPVIVIFNLLWAGWAMAAPYRRYMKGARRFVVRWVSRMATLLLLGFHGSFALPFLPLVAGPLVFALICALVWWYHRFHFIRERERLPILLVEKVLLVVLAVLCLLVFAILIVLAISTGELMKMFDLGG